MGVAFGSIANLSIPVASLLGLGLGAIASSVNQAFFRVRPRPDPKVTSGVQPEIEKDPRCQFQILKDRIHKKEPIYLISEEVLQEEKLLKILGKGGCKRAIELERGRALIVPNMDVEVDFFAMSWKGIVDEEVTMSQLLTKIGLLSPLSQKVRISFSADSDEETIPAYLSETFESLGKTKGWFIIDTKNSKSSNWKQGKDFLFTSEEDRLNENNWDLISDSLLDDVAKMCIYDIPTPTDSINIAIVKKTSKSEISPYEIRYFGFDFSSKSCILSIPKIQERLSKEPNMNKVEGVLNRILDWVFYCEFGKRYDSGTEHARLWGFKNSLVEKYSKEVVIRVNKRHPLISNKHRT